jgi:prepilin-type N-terminal cleavage/methylation domain-containing protein
MTPMESIPGIRTSSHSGFTLVELVAVILILGVLAFSVVPRFLDKGSIDASAMAEQLANDIRYTQSLGMTSGQRNRINLTPTTYQITTSAGAPVAHPATGSTAAISLGNVSLSGYNPPLTNSYIAFDGKGIPYTDVSGIVLAAPATITLNSAGNTRQIVVSPTTGRVIVQ